MNTPDLFTSKAGGVGDSALPRQVMNGKPVFTVPARTVINFDSAFKHKLLCDGPTFSTGSACVYSCAFCYVPDLMIKLRAIPAYSQVKGEHSHIVIRRERALEVLRGQLTDRHGRPKFNDPADRRVIYASPLVDVAGNLDLVRETIEACRAILELTDWQIRLLSKSNLLPKIAAGLEAGWSFHRHQELRRRMIFGVSTGTLDDGLAKVFEAGTPLVSKRIASLRELQDAGWRTFGMICPSLPQNDKQAYTRFAREAAAAIRADRCEHVWAEVINSRGESFNRTISALHRGGFSMEADLLEHAAADKKREWENYAADTFFAHVAALPPGKLRFLQYVTPASKGWWQKQVPKGAVLL